jgi:hypothetical protein
MAPNSPAPEAVAGSRRTAAREQCHQRHTVSLRACSIFISRPITSSPDTMSSHPRTNGQGGRSRRGGGRAASANDSTAWWRTGARPSRLRATAVKVLPRATASISVFDLNGFLRPPVAHCARLENLRPAGYLGSERGHPSRQDTAPLRLLLGGRGSTDDVICRSGRLH